jgi:Protein of unknown function (DUF4238)
MDLSHRHHYVPQFLLRNFTDETDQGFFHVYDKATKQIKRRSVTHSFFQWDRNTVTVDGHQLDGLEKSYADLDNEFAKDLQGVLGGGPVEPEQVAGIILLASTQKWRPPGVDATFNQLKEDPSLRELRAELSWTADAPPGVDAAILERIAGSDLFKEIKRIVLPMLPFVHDEKAMLQIYNNSFIKHYDRRVAGPNLLGDCTIVEQPGSAYNQLGNFVFPLSSWSTFVYRYQLPQAVTDHFKACADLAMIHFSHRYIGCSSREYLATMIKRYHEMQQAVGEQLEGLLLRGLF